MDSARRLPSSACREATRQKDSTVRQQDSRASSRVTTSSFPSLEMRTEGLSFWGRMGTVSFSFISSLVERGGGAAFISSCWVIKIINAKVR
uniref:Uncharacterized protein n=1 Tax=Sus scrofa TaxID=9823 RepID=A0A8D1YVF8_PIG